LAAEIDGRSLFFEFYHSPVSIISVVLATIALPFLWINLNRSNRTWVRIIAAFQTVMIVAGWFAIQFPVVVNKKNEPDLTIQNSSAPDETQFYLLIALIVGVLIVFPAMGYLYKTFKFNPEISSGK